MIIIRIASMKAVPIGCSEAAKDGQTSASTSPITSPPNICNGRAGLTRRVSAAVTVIDTLPCRAIPYAGYAVTAGESLKRRLPETEDPPRQGLHSVSHLTLLSARPSIRPRQDRQCPPHANLSASE